MFRTDAEESDRGVRRIEFGPFEQRRPGFTLPRCFESQMSGIRPHGRHEVSTPKHSSSAGLQRNSFRLLCPLLTSALRSGRLATTSVSLPRHNTDLPR